MPYKDPEKQREFQRRNYRENRGKWRERQSRRRQEPGYRDPEYAKRLGVSVEEYRARKAAGLLGSPSLTEEERDARAKAQREKVARRLKAKANRPKPRARKAPKRTPEEEAEQQGYVDTQRRMREEALAAMRKGPS